MTRVTVLLLIYPKVLAFSLVTGDKARLFLCFNSVLLMADALIAEGGAGERGRGREGRGLGRGGEGGGRGERTKERKDYADRQKDKHTTRSLLLHINKEFTVKI